MQMKVSIQAIRLLPHEQFGRCIYIKNYFARLIYIKQNLQYLSVFLVCEIMNSCYHHP